MNFAIYKGKTTKTVLTIGVRSNPICRFLKKENKLVISKTLAPTSGTTTTTTAKFLIKDPVVDKHQAKMVRK